MVAKLVLVTEKLGHSDIIVVGATKPGDGKTDGNWDGLRVEGVRVGIEVEGLRVEGVWVRIEVEGLRVEGVRVWIEVEGLRVEGVRVGMEVEGAVGVFARIWTRAWCGSFTSDSIDNYLIGCCYIYCILWFLESVEVTSSNSHWLNWALRGWYQTILVTYTNIREVFMTLTLTYVVIIMKQTYLEWICFHRVNYIH